MSSWVKVGAKCVKFRNYKPPQFRGIKTIRSSNPVPIGKEVVVSGVGFDRFWGVPVIMIEGFPNTDSRGEDRGFWVGNFRPLTHKTQSEDIEMFLRIASKAPSNMETTDA